MEPVAGNAQDVGHDADHISSLDEYEIMWKHPEVDSFGHPIGPIFTASLLGDLVTYLRQPNNNGIDFFIDRLIQNPSTPETYESFISCYESCIDRADRKEREKKEDNAAIANLSRYRKIDLAMKAVHQIVVQTSVTNIREWIRKETSSVQRSDSYYEAQRCMMHRLLLLYHEIPYLRGKWYLTYDTGYPPLDKQIHSILGSLLKDPQALSHSEAREYGKSLFLACRDLVHYNQVPGLWSEADQEQLREGFGDRYRREYIRTRSSFSPWTDTSGNRNP